MDRNILIKSWRFKKIGTSNRIHLLIFPQEYELLIWESCSYWRNSWRSGRTVRKIILGASQDRLIGIISIRRLIKIEISHEGGSRTILEIARKFNQLLCILWK